jgi:hypothetical protein
VLPYDVHIAYVSWGDDGKHRPVVILYTEIGSVTVLTVTTKYEGKSESIRSKYIEIKDWQKAGLETQSYIDANRAYRLPLSLIKHSPIGTLTDRDREALIKRLK